MTEKKKAGKPAVEAGGKKAKINLDRLEMPKTKGIAGWVAETGQSLLVPDAHPLNTPLIHSVVVRYSDVDGL